jgi:hypothetical protein
MSVEPRCIEGYSTMMARTQFCHSLYLDGKHAALTRRCGSMTLVPAVESFDLESSVL